MLDQMGLLEHYRWYEAELYSGRYGSPRDRYLLSTLNGLWIAADGTVILLRGGFARVYDRFGQMEDFYVKIGGQQLLFRSIYRGGVRGYDLKRHGRYLWLRDRFGNQRMFIKVIKPR